MSKRNVFLTLTLLFSLLFIALITAGSYLISLKTQPEKQFGIAAFLFAFASALGQMGSFALFIRCVAREKANKIIELKAKK
ncbi:NGO_0222 family membrane protein [Wielerella bovis]|uniref:NGO_0222 family membrane protein n=1 Tax=Wielerella bovis TaxID=2917790 RepID=UPI00201905CE|nr:NGO_0222 family membrane protein [Wielerella bovis]MCG7656451.1 hypothetical protein [Wielerella bovis]MCG7658676.1 hypothetical protein [Wielerella bovis]ULJ62964.1 hypothetical protein MIS46_02560 [Wielerella bovis]ULJ65195.1 hypothetical protein MIS33_02620 [Wielerella bovis]ULJ67541.1 hypothetical protein MIS31_02995 [Wielerella bovis]